MRADVRNEVFLPSCIAGFQRQSQTAKSNPTKSTNLVSHNAVGKFACSQEATWNVTLQMISQLIMTS